METNTKILANRFREVILNGTWVVYTNYKAQLTGLDWQIATTAVESLNTIAALAQHIHYYIEGVNNVFRGGNLEIRDKYSFDFPPIISQNQWEEFLTKFWKDSEDFAYLVEQMSDQQLNEYFVDEKYGSVQRNIDAMIEHAYYHLGQIVMLKKLLINKTY
ncbi:DUF1572 family protein [Runella sp. MFBS21]|uniref:DUF1572 family protein n=1 Tax=Runella sp. MFBS21 TaxID=3034018 RepID=UPI0023F7C9F2|nr:DUF1572 family protein [Runella sp. MFBS21]MDF7821105.1 DUF1572 family protein [Runella sp. MFBS21]